MPETSIRLARPDWLLYAVAFLILAASAGYGALRYPNLPERFPIHWNAAGFADGYAGKSIGTAFFGVFIGLGVLLLFLVIAWLLGRAAQRQGIRPIPHLAATQRFLGVLSIVLALVFWLVNQQVWAVSEKTTNPLLLVLLIAVGLAIAAIFANRRYRAELGKLPPRDPAEPAPDPREDERFWAAGFVYHNPDDRSVIVPKRSGLGYTVNWGRPGGKALLLGVLAIPVVAVGIALWAAMPR
ncbi:DUF1648 domain-containing protein [Arthrobacter russicus]|uniref:Membrane protein n=1 Tax=Arthrobacter russicus TaxID=172040 RepID=A0ABU1JD82_9MICC|nr:DUF1648 domain-containing protein [Arthrobacter russicus]MDR6270378.1 putative membrane protein [Arthrobacter russicus]